MREFERVKLGKHNGTKSDLATVKVGWELLDKARQAQHEDDVFLDCAYIAESETDEFDAELRDICEKAIEQGVHTLLLYR